jgi:hypothetical protein
VNGDGKFTFPMEIGLYLSRPVYLLWVNKDGPGYAEYDLELSCKHNGYVVWKNISRQVKLIQH